MTTPSMTVNISGIPTEIKLEEIEIDKIRLDQENPRIGFQKDTQPFSELNEDQMAFALSNKNVDAFNKLKENIEINEGIVNPIWVEPLETGMYLAHFPQVLTKIQ